MVWPIMGDACRRSIHLKDGVEASQRVRRSGRSAPSSTFAFNEQSGNCSGPEVQLWEVTAPVTLAIDLWADDGPLGSCGHFVGSVRTSACIDWIGHFGAALRKSANPQDAPSLALVMGVHRYDKSLKFMVAQ